MARPKKGSEKSRPHLVGFRVSEETRAALESVAARLGKPMSDVANEALDEYLKKHAKPARRAIRVGRGVHQ